MRDGGDEGREKVGGKDEVWKGEGVRGEGVRG